MNERPIFNVAQLLKDPVGATRSGEIEVDLHDLIPDLEPGGADEPEAVLAGPVRLMNVTTGVLVQSDLTGQITMSCVRCLEPVVVPLHVELEENFAPTIDIITGQPLRPEEEDRALWIDEHHILDLTEVLRQDILVAVPMHVVCRESCRGLCPSCGKNLNEGDCDCKAEPDPRWAALSELLKDSDSE